MPQSPLRRWLDEHPDSVQIVFPNEYQLQRVHELLARADFPFRWVSENTIFGPPGCSRTFVGLRWILSPPDQRLLQAYSAAS